jgi:hypothetical protein
MDGKTVAFERPLQKLSKLGIVFDYQNGDGTMVGRFDVQSFVLGLSGYSASRFQVMHNPSSNKAQGVHLLSGHETWHPVHHADGSYRLLTGCDERYSCEKPYSEICH